MEITLPPDFKDFLKLLSVHNVKYLLIGGYAVGYHGYPRSTNDMDEIDGIKVDIIGLEELKINKKASGRHKDLDDFENLP